MCKRKSSLSLDFKERNFQELNNFLQICEILFAQNILFPSSPQSFLLRKQTALFFLKKEFFFGENPSNYENIGVARRCSVK